MSLEYFLVKVKANVDLVDTTVKVGDRQSLNASLGLNADTGRLSCTNIIIR